MFNNLVSIFGVRAVLILGGFALTLVVAQQGGAVELGKLAVYVSAFTFFSIFGKFGNDVLLLRKISAKRKMSNKRKTIYLLYHTFRSLRFSIPVSAVCICVVYSGMIGEFSASELVLIVTSIYLYSVLSNYSSFYKADGKIALAPIFEISGVSTVACIVYLCLNLIGIINAQLSVFLSLCILFFFGPIRIQSLKKVFKSYRKRGNLRPEIYLTIVASSTYITTTGSLLLVAFILSSEQLGILRASERIGLVVGFSMLAIEPFLQPKIASLVAQNRFYEIRRLLRIYSLLGFTLGLTTSLMISGNIQSLVHLFGDEFSSIDEVYIYFVISQVAFVSMNPFVTFLNIGGHETVSGWINALSVALSCVLMPFLTHEFDVLGFSISYCGVMSFRLLLSTIVASKILWSEKKLGGKTDA